jgi:feruloyl esterase
MAPALVIGFDLRSPTQWNGRFAFHGGGGMDGRLVPAVGDIHRTLEPSALARGFAVISSDGGRRGSWTDSTFGQTSRHESTTPTALENHVARQAIRQQVLRSAA